MRLRFFLFTGTRTNYQETDSCVCSKRVRQIIHFVPAQRLNMAIKENVRAAADVRRMRRYQSGRPRVQTPTSAFHRQLHSRSHQPTQHRPVLEDVKMGGGTFATKIDERFSGRSEKAMSYKRGVSPS